MFKLMGKKINTILHSKCVPIWSYVMCFALFCIGNIPLEKEATIKIVSTAMHRNEQIFQDPHRFDLERYLTDSSLERHPYAYIPFSAGARNCIA